MSFSNPSGGAADNSERYVAALLALLGERDPVAVQATLVDDIERIVEGVDGRALGRAEAPGKWSMRQIVQHLAHTEIVFAFRYRVVLAEDNPAIPAFDQDRWVERLAGDHASLDLVLPQLRAFRAWNIALLQSLTPAQWQRSGHHAERGVESVRRIAELGAAHDLVHVKQLARVKAAVTVA